MIITIPSLIAAGIATGVVTGGIMGTAVYLTAGEADVVTGDQIKTEGGLHILKLGHMEPWAIAMMCATVLIGMGTCGACCHRKGKSYVRDKEAKLRDRVLGRAKELVHMKAHGADKLLEDVQTYHDMHEEIVVQKMHQITPPSTDGAFAERPCGNPQCGKCKKPRHITVGFCNAKQKATIINADSKVDVVSDVDAESNFAAPIHPQAKWEEQSERASGQQPDDEHCDQDAVATKKHCGQDAVATKKPFSTKKPFATKKCRCQDTVAADGCRGAKRPLRQQRLSPHGKLASQRRRQR
jgi:hypothetical protein